MMIWQLLQVGHVAEAPLILVGKMWPGLVEWARTAMLSSDPPLANPKDLDLPKCVTGADEAMTLIRKHHSLWKKKQSHMDVKPRKGQGKRK
jgi:hypothetical protein